MNYALAYAVIQRAQVLIDCCWSYKQIKLDLQRRYPHIQQEQLEEIIERASQSVS